MSNLSEKPYPKKITKESLLFLIFSRIFILSFRLRFEDIFLIVETILFGSLEQPCNFIISVTNLSSKCIVFSVILRYSV